MHDVDIVRAAPLPRLDLQCLLDTPEARLRLVASATMAGTLALELNQALCAATNFVNASLIRLHRSDEDREGTLAMIELASREMRKAGEIVRQMTNFVRRGRIRGCRENLAAIIEKAISGSVGADGAPVEVDWTVDWDARFVIVDRILIARVFSAILQGAGDAHPTSDGRCFSIEAKRIGMEVVVHIGRGFCDSDLVHLLEPSLATGIEAAGLDRSMCKAIVEAHGGRLWAEGLPRSHARLHLSLPAAD
jgi:two-component system, LuxR family, sensor kinase FixL